MSCCVIYLYIYKLVFKEFFSTKLVERLASLITETQLASGDLLFTVEEGVSSAAKQIIPHEVTHKTNVLASETEFERESLYAVLSGCVQQVIDLPKYNEGRGIVLRRLRKDEFIGDYAFFSGIVDASVNYRAEGFCNFYRLRRCDFLATL
jgi:CRP-like cAMP-binding protein